MIAELAAAALSGFLAAGTGWLLDRQREATKLERTRSLLMRAILDDLAYSQQIYDKVAEEWEKTKIVWFSTLNELKQSRQPDMVVERSFAWATRCRRLVKDYERYAETLVGFHVIAFVGYMLRHAADPMRSA